MNALLVYQNAELPSSRIRIIQMAPYLDAQGIACRLLAWPRGLREKLQVRACAARADVVVLQKKLATVLDAQIFAKANLVFDYDDAIMFRDRPKRGSFHSRSRRRRFRRMCRISHGVIAGNRYLAALAGQSRVLIAASPVPHDVPQRQHRETGELRIGWIGLGHNVDALDTVRAAFRALGPGFRLVVISNRPYVGADYVPWSLATQEAEIAKLDVGIMPLAEDSPFTRGKCSYKLLQYMAAGVPCVASPIGMNVDVVRPGDNGLLAGTTEEWIAALRTLASSAERRARMGAAGRRDVEAQFTYPSIAHRWAAFLRDVRR